MDMKFLVLIPFGALLLGTSSSEVAARAAGARQAQPQPIVEEETEPGDYSELFGTEEDQDATKLTRKQRKALRKRQKRERAERENQERLNRLEANRPIVEEDEDENSTEVNADENSDSENVSETQKDKKKDKKLKKGKKDKKVKEGKKDKKDKKKK